MRFLLIANHTPEAHYGTGQRLLSIKQALMRLGEVRFLWLHPQSQGVAEMPEGIDYCVEGGFQEEGSRLYWTWRQVVASEFRAYRPATRTVERICRDDAIDVVVCSFFRSATAAPLGAVPCLLDADCIPEPQGRVGRAFWPWSRWIMRRRAARFATTFVIRSSDAKALDLGRTRLLPALSATAGRILDPDPDARNVLFVGNADWPPNRAGIRFLIDELAPILARRHPALKVRIVGKGTNDFEAGPNVSLGGFVQDLGAEYRAARIVVCPVFNGGGANVKLAEALQLGAACVATSYSAEAFGDLVVPGRDLLTAQAGDDFVRLVCDLVGDEDALAALRAGARQVAATALSQTFVDKVVREAVEDAVRGPLPNRRGARHATS